MRRTFPLLVIVAALSGGWPPTAPGATREIPAVRDNTLYDFAADTLSSNGAGPYFFAGRNSQGNTRRGLLRFPVADSLPAGAVIDSVELRLNMSQSQTTIPREVSLHRITADWGEGTSFSTGGQGATPADGDATWIHRFFPDPLWDAPGGDFQAPASAATQVGAVGVYRWSGSALSADVQAWLDEPDLNFGWILLGDETTISTAKRFDSRESGTPANRPLLVIHYSPGVPAVPVTWGAVKAGSGR